MYKYVQKTDSGTYIKTIGYLLTYTQNQQNF